MKAWHTYRAIWFLLGCVALFCIISNAMAPVYVHGSSATITSPVPTPGAYTPVEDDESERGEIVLLRENSEIANLRSQIGDKESRIRNAEEEIRGINIQLSQIYEKKDSLESKLNGLTLTKKEK